MAKAKGIELDRDGGPLTLQQVAALAGEAEITVRRAIWRGELPAKERGFRYQIALVDAAAYVVEGRKS